jgi:cyclopropane-fatty-acyl-phospholipid synthase
MSEWPIAVHTDDANAQHYELPAAFFSLVLGPRRKYSSCLYASPATTLAEAEIAALEETCLHADLADGQDILELGCGWGSLSLFMAERFPSGRIVSVSNSSSQRTYIEAEAKRRGLRNLTVITADMNTFSPDGTFDRIVSVEMFEHMSNWHCLLQRARSWIRDDGRLFLHVFSHRKTAYRFDHADKADWIAQYFFTGGVMPSHGLVRAFDDSFTVERDWRWNGKHYERTAQDWLDNFDRNRDAVRAIFEATYGKDAPVWMRRWRMFFLATAGLFGHAGGEEWGVSHYRLSPAGAGR